MPALERVADGVWTSTTEVRLLKVMRIPAAMTVVRLGGDEVMVHSPVPLTPARRAEVDALGRVTHLYSPNAFHHLSLGFWSEAYPKAKVHAPKALVKKRPDLRIDRFHGTPEPAFDGLLEEVHVDAFRLSETVVFHRASKTLIVADVLQNMVPTHTLTRWYATLAGFNGVVGVSGVIRKTAFPDHAATKKSLEQILALDFERIVVGHGDVITGDAKTKLARAYDWLG